MSDGMPAGLACPVSEVPLGTVAGSSEAPLSGADLGRLALDPDGAIWIAPRAETGLLLRYGLDEGDLELHTMILAPGSERPLMIDHVKHVEDDGPHVFAQGSLVRLSRTGEVRNRTPLPTLGRVGDVAVFRDGRYVLNGPVSDPEGMDRPVHIVNPDGDLLHSLSERIPSLATRYHGSAEGFRVLALAHDESGVWIAARNAYEITRWSSTGVRELTLRRNVDWFEPWTEWVPPTQASPPPRLRDLASDESGRLWTRIIVADPEFEPLPPPDPGALHMRYAEDSRQYDSVLEVLDPDSGAVLAHCRYPGHASLQPGGPYLVRPSVTPDGEQRFEVFRLELRPDG